MSYYLKGLNEDDAAALEDELDEAGAEMGEEEEKEKEEEEEVWFFVLNAVLM